MKKVALSLAGVLAAAAFAPEASALPVFARQTGMACNACHFQHFPILNGFGRSFKASGFTLMGAQGKVEGDELSIPDRLNMAVLTTAGVEMQNGNTNVATGGNHNTVHVPGNGGELSVFFGGRISDNAGFLTEFGASGAPGMSAAKLPFMYEIAGGMRAGVVFMTTSGQGPSYSFEILNTGATAIHLATPMGGLGRQHFGAVSAHQYLGVNTGAVGASAVVVNPDMFFVNVGKYALDSAAVAVAAAPLGVATVNNIGNPQTNELNATYARGAFLFDAAGFNMAVGAMSVAGSDALNLSKTQMTVFDFQLMGDIGSNTLLVTATIGSAPAGTAAMANAYNAGTQSKTSTNLFASFGVTPHASVFAGFRQAKTGAAANNADNAIQIGGTYGLAQNVELSLTHTRQSGSAWNIVAPATTATAGQNATSLKVEALF